MMNKCLVVDDQFTVRRLLKGILEAENYDVTLAEDGRDGWEKASGNKFDVILVDLDMPKMNGIELCQRIKKSGTNKQTPVLIISIEKYEHRKQEGRDAGAVGWILKPISSEKLIPVLNNLVS